MKCGCCEGKGFTVHQSAYIGPYELSCMPCNGTGEIAEDVVSNPRGCLIAIFVSLAVWGVMLWLAL